MPRSRWTALPATRSKAPVLQIRLYAVLGALLLSSVAGIWSAISWSNNKAPLVAPVYTPDTASASATVATDYLLGKSTPVPVAPPASGSSGPSWSLDQNLGISPGAPTGARAVYSLVMDHSGSHPHGYIISPYGQAPSIVYVETDYYVAVTNFGTYDVSVPMYITSAGPELAALPSLQNYTPHASPGYTGLDYHVLTGYAAPTQAMIGAATAWARDYVGNFAALGVQVGNPSGATNYRGLSGFTFVSASSIGTVPGSGTDSSYIYLRERLVIHPSRANGVTLSMDMDLMLASQTSGATYSVVAWGPAGSAGNLVPYQTNLTTNQ